MTIRLLAFATASDAIGGDQIEIEITSPTTVGSLKRDLEERYPALGPLWQRLAVAINGQIATDSDPVTDGDEIALLPPVSGGTHGATLTGELTSRARIVESAIDPAEVTRSVSGPGSGAVLLFLGTVRDHHAGRSVDRITYFAYESMAETVLRRIVSELEQGQEGLRLAIVHRTGTVEVGEASVAIAAASPHREAAYQASRLALERLKAEAPIWKREHYEGGEQAWREEEPLRTDGSHRARD